MRTVIYKSFHVISFKVEKDGDKFHAFCRTEGCHTRQYSRRSSQNLKNAVSLYIDQELEEQTFDDLINEAKSMSNIISVRKKLIKLLGKHSFYFVRQNGSHALFKNFKNNLKVIVPIHSKIFR